jgi:drug/metabolite transporter (DMT)-like permease
MRLVALAGICFFGLNYLAVYAGSQYLTSGVVAVILSLTVPLNLFAEWIIRGRRPTRAMIGAAALGMCGISLVFGSDLSNAFTGQMRWWGASIVAGSAILVAIGNVVSSELMRARLSWILVNALGMAVGCAAALVWGGLAGAAWVFQPTASWFAGYAYLVLLGSVVAFGIYMKILPTIGTTAGAYVTVLSPVLALLVSAALEGFRIRLTTYAGVALLLLGHTFLIRQRSRSQGA